MQLFLVDTDNEQSLISFTRVHALLLIYHPLTLSLLMEVASGSSVSGQNCVYTVETVPATANLRSCAKFYVRVIMSFNFLDAAQTNRFGEPPNIKI